MGPSPAPRITVLMAVHDGAAHLAEAVGDILVQTEAGFEFIVVDDASTDGTAAILDAVDDPRLVRLRNDTHLGLTRSLNRGLERARGTFVARLDADDRCPPRRLEIQAGFLDAHPDHVLVASSFRRIDDAGRELARILKPMGDTELRWIFQLRTAVEHGSVMFRRALPGVSPPLYDPRFATAQDYDLWLRLLDHGKGRVLAEVLLDYRIHPRSVTATRRREQVDTIRAVALDHARRAYGLDPDGVEKVDALLRLYLTRDDLSGADFDRAVAGLDLLAGAFIAARGLDRRAAAYIRARGAGQLWHALADRPGLGPVGLARLALRAPGTLGPLLRRVLGRGRPLDG